MFAARLQREITQRWCLWYNSLVSVKRTNIVRESQNKFQVGIRFFLPQTIKSSDDPTRGSLLRNGFER